MRGALAKLSFNIHKQPVDLILPHCAGVAHTEDKKAALEKLKQSKSQLIYIVDNCPASEPTAAQKLYCKSKLMVKLDPECCSAGARIESEILTLICDRCDMMCAGIDRNSWQGGAVVFCSQHKGLWGDKASQRRGRLVLCVGPASIEELLSMRNALPKYRVSTRHGSTLQPHAMTAFRLRPSLASRCLSASPNNLVLCIRVGYG